LYAVAVSFSKSTLFVHSNIYIALILSVVMRYNVNFPDFQVNSNGNYVMTLGQSLFSQLYGRAIYGLRVQI